MTREGGSNDAGFSTNSTATAALMVSIRGRVVEYKELLLRQLVDQRVALLAIDADAHVKRAVEEKTGEDALPTEELKEEEDDNDEEEEDEEEEDDEEDEEEEEIASATDVEMVEEMEADQPVAAVNGHLDPVETKAAEEEDDESVDRKRRASTEPVAVSSHVQIRKTQELPPTSTPTATPATSAAPKPPATVASTSTSTAPLAGPSQSSPAPRVVKRIRRASFVSGDYAPPPPVPGARAVARSSTPPRRYLDQRDDLVDDTTHQQLVLRQPTRVPHSRPTAILAKPRAASSVEDVQAEFEQKLRVTMRLQREVTRRSVAVTRKRQLPRLPTPARTKSQWDYLLEEMRWMAMDFSQERNWKRGVQWHLAQDVVVARNAERVRREKETRQLARDMSMQVAAFWRTMERIAARSQVRFEGGSVSTSESGGRRRHGGSGGGSGSGSGSVDEQPEVEQKDESRSDTSSSSVESTAVGDVPLLKFKTLELASADDAETSDHVRTRLQEMLATSRRARCVLSGVVDPHTDRERAIQRVLEARTTAAVVTTATVSPSTLLATFQIVALRWMLELCLSGGNVLLNDQVGMGQSATIAAFLSVLHELEVAGTTAMDVSRPHLVIVPADELHKWCFFLREWNHSHGLIQLYSGSSSSSATHRKRLQSEWTKKLTVPQFFSSDDVADLEKEDATPLFACVCSAEDFAVDREAFLAFGNWQTLVVEMDQGGLLEDIEFVASLNQIPHHGRRVLSCSQPLEAWPTSQIRVAYAQFLLRETATTAATTSLWDKDAWTKRTVLEKTSAQEIIKWFGNQTGSTALLKSQQDHLSALSLALQCLSLRRVRSEVESELGKLDETSVACALSPSQVVQYRHAVAAFAAASSSDRLALWLQLVLKLRSVCNCVDVLHDAEKLALADVSFLVSCSGKLQQLHELLNRVVEKEHRRVVVYCQLDAMLGVVEMLLALLGLRFVYVTGSVEMQRRALCHFALKPAVQVALVSTRVASAHGKQAMPVYGADVVVVLDSDWQATCDAKLRASWAKCAVGNLQVYRFHCDATIEAALLRSGSCFSEKVFSEMGPQELLAAGDSASKIETPSWWTANGVASTTLAETMAQVETSEQYRDASLESTSTLQVVNVELSAEEHLLLANADELTPVEWYAVNYLASSSTSEKKRLENEHSGGADDHHHDALHHLATVGPRQRTTTTTLEQLAVQESKRVWQKMDATTDMFYDAERVQRNGLEISEAMLESVLQLLRAKGLEPHYELAQPPQAPVFTELVDSEPQSISENASPEMLFRVGYREPAPPAPPPSLILKLKTDASTAAALAAVSSSDASGKPLKTKKRNKDAAGRAGGAAGAAGAAAASGGGAGAGAGSVTGHKRKQDGGGANSKPSKEPRLDFDGIPLPSDMAEFADDDFWGDTNLDALDSAAWDDPAVLSGILGPTLEVPAPSGSASGATASSGAGSTGSAPTTKKKSKAGAAAGGTGANAQGGTGRARKGSVSDSNKDGGWHVQDDLVLKKLFELYGSNWTLIAHVLNTATSVSRFVVRKRTPRQCYDRYGKIISSGSSLLSSSSGGSSAMASPTKDGSSAKSTSSSLLKQHKLNAAAAALWTPQVLAERIGIPLNEMLVVFAARDSLPGLPPPSIVNVPSLAELSMKKKKKKKQQQLQSDSTVSATATATATTASATATALPGAPVLDDLKSIRTSFDAILQCMKRKTPPPPIPIPQASTASTATSSSSDSTATTATNATGSTAAAGTSSTTATSTTSSVVAGAVPGASPTKPSIVTPVPTTVPPPHKSHMDLVALLPRGALTPEEVIKRSKEAAAVAVQAAAAVASAGRAHEISPLASAGDVMMNAAFGSNSAAAIAARKASAAAASSLASGGAAAAAAAARPGGFSAASAATTTTKAMSAGGSWGDSSASAMARPPHAATPALQQSATQPSSQQQQQLASSVNGMAGTTTTATPSSSSSSSVSSRSSGSGAAAANVGPGGPAMPVTTSALLHVLDRMPEIKHKIQAILNRTDCSEAQKVAMIARLLSNTNAINATAVAAAASGNLTAAVTATLSGSGAASGSGTGNATATSTPTAGSTNPTAATTSLADPTASTASLGFAASSQSLDTPIPMPAEFATSSAVNQPLPMPASIGGSTAATPSVRTSSTSGGTSGSGGDAISRSISDEASAAALASALADTDMSELT